MTKKNLYILSKIILVVLLVIYFILFTSISGSYKQTFPLHLQAAEYDVVLFIILAVLFDIATSIIYFKREKGILDIGCSKAFHGFSIVVLVISIGLISSDLQYYFNGGNKVFDDLQYADNPAVSTFYVKNYEYRYHPSAKGVSKNIFLYYEDKVYAYDKNKNQLELTDMNNFICRYSFTKGEYKISYYPNTGIIVKADFIKKESLDDFLSQSADRGI